MSRHEKANALYLTRGYRISLNRLLKKEGLHVNAACPCGSGKKLKKCHLLQLWETPDKTVQLLEEMNIHEKKKETVS